MEEDKTKREAAIKRLEAKQGFNIHLILYVAVNLLLVFIWAVSGFGYFWPIWPILGWGIAVALHGWMIYFQRPITEEDIRKEMDRGG